MAEDHKMTYADPWMLPETKGFWEALNEKKLVIRTCMDCGRGHHFPRAMCPHCYSENLEWKESDGTGTIYSFTAQQVKGGGKYVYAYVEIADRVRAITNIVDCDPEALQIGQKVKAAFRPSASGQNILVFTPA